MIDFFKVLICIFSAISVVIFFIVIFNRMFYYIDNINNARDALSKAMVSKDIVHIKAVEAFWKRFLSKDEIDFLNQRVFELEADNEK